MKKFFSFVLMILCIACMTGCKLHGGHGAGPDTTGEALMTFGTHISVDSLPASVRSAMRGAISELHININGLELPYVSIEGDYAYFGASFAKNLIEALAGTTQNVQIKRGETIEFQIPSVKISENIIEASESDQDVTDNKAVIVLTENDNNEFTYVVLTVKMLTEIEDAEKTMSQVLTAIKDAVDAGGTADVVANNITNAIKDLGVSNDTMKEVEIETVDSEEGNVEVVKFDVSFKEATITGYDGHDDSSWITGFELGNTISNGGSITRTNDESKGVALITSPALFEGDDEGDVLVPLEQYSLKMTVTKEGSSTTRIIENILEGKHVFEEEQGIHIYTKDSKWFIVPSSQTSAGTFNVTINEIKVSSQDGSKVYVWNSPTTFTVTIK